MTKLQLITDVYNTNVQTVTKTVAEWQRFLQSACRNYKCAFDEQLLIYAQRSDATAVLEIKKWNKLFGRGVNRGATGIVVFDRESSGSTQVKHYFDISDTHESRYSKPVPVWEMREDYEAYVIESLENSFGELDDKSSLAQSLISAAHNATEDNLADYLTDLMNCRAGSFLEEFDELSVGVAYRKAVQNSVVYMLLARCGIDTAEYFSQEDFGGVSDFNTAATVNILGAATGDIAEMVLREISATVLNLQKSERSNIYTFANKSDVSHNGIKDTKEGRFDNGNDLFDGGRLPSAELDNAGGNGRDGETGERKIRNETSGISQKSPQGSIHEPADLRQAERTFGRDSANGNRAYEFDDTADGGSAGRDRGVESYRPNEVGGVNEQHPTFGGGNDTVRADLQLKPSLPKVAEQLDMIEQAEEKSSIFSSEKSTVKYNIHLGDKVYIGTKAYEISEFDDATVRLLDTQFPLFSEEMPREEFDRKLSENPLNGHLMTSAVEAVTPWQNYLNIKVENPNNPLMYQVGDFIELFGEDAKTAAKLLDIALVTRDVGGDKKVDMCGFPLHRLEDNLKVFTDNDYDVILHAIEDSSGEYRTVTMVSGKERNTPNIEVEKHPITQPNEHHNYCIADDSLGTGSAKAKFRANMDAIQLLQDSEFDGRLATPEEQTILAKYVGWGGLSDAFDETKSTWSEEFTELYANLSQEEYAAARESTLTAFYTPPVVIRAMYTALENMGFETGNILDPAFGIGNFNGLLPDSMKNSRVYSSEIDSISGRIAQQLYQKSNIAVKGFEETDFPDSFFDVAVGNVPFGDFKVPDRRYDKYNFKIHDYFFARTLDKVRPGGVIAFITSKGTMDKQNPAIRKYIAQRAELLGAIRLPDNTFKANAGTEVTSDIIFLQKRDRITDIEPDWVHLNTDENGIAMNGYFTSHPDMILGDMVMESSQFGMDSVCKPYPDRELSDLLNKAIQNIHAEITEYERDEETEADNSIPADPTVRNFSYVIVTDDDAVDEQIYFRENSRMYPKELSLTAQNRVKGMVEIRDCVRALIEYQSHDYPDSDIKTEQAKLNRLYDSYTKKYGLLNDRANDMAFSDDSAYPLLCSLEILDENNRLKTKADMFTKRTIRPQNPVTSVDTAVEALAVSIGEKARVDLAFMAELSGKRVETLIKELDGIIFRVPDAAVYVTADEYLSGNVREKLIIVRATAEHDPAFLVNVKALEVAQPQDLTAPQISVRLGATWLPPDAVEAFIYEILDTSWRVQDKIKVLYSKHTAEWNVTGKSVDNNNVKSYSAYGTSCINAYHIIESSLNLRNVRVFDTKYDEHGKEIRVLNKKETAIAQDKQDIIKAKFAEWIWSDPDRRERLCKLYNERFNSIRPREYDGSHIQFVGMNPEIKLLPHQINAVARILYGGNTMLAHCVGAGKTFEMIAAAMESKRLGLCDKPMFVVPNNIIGDFTADFFRLYPSANVLMATKKDFEKKNRRKFFARIATGDYDGIIIGHSQLEKLPLSVERQEHMIQRQINSINLGIADVKQQRGERFTIKQMERSRKALEVKLKKLNDQSRKDDLLNFEDLGVDRLFVDEADMFKNLYLVTKMRNVGGIAQTEAQKASDLFMKTQYLDERTGGKGVVFATGTPVSNSMAELYTMQRYLQYDTLKKNGLELFDCWASTFGETVTAMELTPEGSGFRMKTRFANFYNLPELMAMFKDVADIQTPDMLNLPVPKAEYHVVTTEPSELQTEMLEGLAERAELVRNRMVESHEDNMLLITNDGRKLALDQRLINPMLPNDPDGKVNACINNVFEIWERTEADKLTQLIFSDISTPKKDNSFSVYDEIRNKLIAKGVPVDEIAFIHSANNEAQKMEMFAKVRSGTIRVLLGSTFKMGAGTNVQDRLIALHDLDCPWRPRDLEQRRGRIVRRGNMNTIVQIYRYITKRTFDAYLFQMIENKQRSISQVFTSKSPARVMAEVDDAVLSYAEIKALATGNPMIIERCNLDAEVSKLNLIKSNFLSERYMLEDDVLKRYPAEIKMLEGRIAGYETDMARVASQPPVPEDRIAPMRIGDVVYTDKKAAGNAIIERCKAKSKSEAEPFGEYRGFEMELSFEPFYNEFRAVIKGALSHKVTLGDDVFGNITRLDNALEAFEDKRKGCEEHLSVVKAQMETAEIEMAKPFDREQELQEKTERLAELTIALKLDEKDKEVVDDVPDEGEVAVSERKSRDRER